MIKCRYIIWFYILIFFNNFQNSQSLIQCYLCADCGDPFNKEFPYTTIVTNQNFGASCIKTVLTVPNGKIVSRGTTFNCASASTSDIKVYCCQEDLCNKSNSLKQITFLLLFAIFIHFLLI